MDELFTRDDGLIELKTRDNSNLGAGAFSLVSTSLRDTKSG